MKQIVLKHSIESAPKAKDFTAIDVARPECPDGGVLVKVKFISIDPYVGHLLNKGHMHQKPPIPMKGKIPSGIVGEVIESDTPKVKKGDHIHATDGWWAEFNTFFDNEFTVVDAKAAPLSTYAGVLGMPGLTAWSGVTQLARVHDGDVFAVNAAAGPVGGTAGQIARMRGAKTVIGIAGGPEKCKMVQDVYGFDACVDYKSKNWKDDYKAAVPDGVSVHYENVGADQLAFAMQNLNLYGRVVLCGLAAHYHSSEPAMTLIGPIVGKRATVHGLVVYDFYPRWEEFRAEVAPWVKSGKVTITEDRVEGLDNAGALMEKLMTGKNVGKCIVAL
ncbi:zinc-binding dehydrogenase [Fretibacter rubidus]|uniref:zinc-binding dehydrogenase n=1 Tax=Fretibacter rubidus TaxID=570162 RepID=UPI00352A0703